MPAKDSVTIRMTAEDAGAWAEWRKQAKGPEMMGDAIEKAAQKGKTGAQQLGAELVTMAGHWAAVALSIETAKRVLADYYATKRSLEQEEAGASAAADSAIRGYFKTARISSEKQQSAATARIGAVALRQKTSLATAGGAANALAQFGVPSEQAEGGALEEMLQLQQAAPAGADPQEFSRRVLQIIRRSAKGGKITAGAIHGVGVTMRQLTSSDLGFNEDAADLYARYATSFQQAGYDQPTGMALSAAITEKYDARQARGIINQILKPGMQKGEAELLKRARGALGPGGEGQYKEAAEIGRGSVASLQAESETGGILGEVGEKQLTRPQILQRLKAVLAAQGASEDQIAHAVNTYEHPPLSYLSPIDFWSDETRAQGALREFYQDTKTPVGVRQKAFQQTLGNAPLPTTIRIKGQDGRDVPHSVEAAGIPGR